MYIQPTVFSQLIGYIKHKQFAKCVERYQGNYRAKTFLCWDQFLCMFFAQLTWRNSLADIECCLRVNQEKLYHMGIKGHVSHTNLARANEKRDWRIYQDFAQILIQETRKLYCEDDLGLELEEIAYALDASTIDLCLSVFPWAKFRKAKAAIKLHTLLDLRGDIPSFIHITDGKVHDVKVLDILIFEAGSIYIMDRGYVDFKRLYRLHQAGAFFVIRAKKRLSFRAVASVQVDLKEGVLHDQTIVLTGVKTRKQYPDRLRRIVYRDFETGKRFVFLTNHFHLPARTIADLYRYRWRVELFFKWIKQHLRIKKFYGTSENAVKTQIWIAICVYILVVIIKKKLALKQSLYETLQLLSVIPFEQKPLVDVFFETVQKTINDPPSKQLSLWDL